MLGLGWEVASGAKFQRHSLSGLSKSKVGTAGPGEPVTPYILHERCLTCLILILAPLILPLFPQPSWVMGSSCPALMSLPLSFMPLTFLWGPLGSGCSELQHLSLPLDFPGSTSLLALTSLLPFDLLHVSPVLPQVYTTWGL